jgi:hypothetical protein
MEFAITYKAQSIEELCPNWPQRADVKASVLTSAGISYLEAAFSFVREIGRDMIGILQNAYVEHTKGPHVIRLNPLIFLEKTPEVNDLEINPVPDQIIKTWYDDILVGVRNYFPENQFRKQMLEAEFNQTYRQLEHEWNDWNIKTGGAIEEAAELTDTESNIIEALGTETLRGAALLKEAGYDNSSHYRSILSNLRKRGVLGHGEKGYFVKNKG